MFIFLLLFHWMHKPVWAKAFYIQNQYHIMLLLWNLLSLLKISQTQLPSITIHPLTPFRLFLNAFSSKHWFSWHLVCIFFLKFQYCVILKMRLGGVQIYVHLNLNKYCKLVSVMFHVFTSCTIFWILLSIPCFPIVLVCISQHRGHLSIFFVCWVKHQKTFLEERERCLLVLCVGK